MVNDKAVLSDDEIDALLEAYDVAGTPRHIDALQAAYATGIQLIVHALLAVEWQQPDNGGPRFCSACRQVQPGAGIHFDIATVGHKPSCVIDNVLRKAGVR